jgi:DNA-binding transcriptional MerR regulator
MNQSQLDPAETTPPAPAGDALEAAPVAPTPDTLLTRSEAARELGKHVSTIRRWEQKSVLTPTVGDDGVHRFPRRQLLELVEVRERTTATRAAAPADYDDGVTTAAVFELFAQGLAPHDVVVQKKLPATAVLALHRSWLAMRGAFVVSREVAAQIELLRGDPIVDESSLLRSIQRSPPNTHCTTCHEELIGSEALCRYCARDIRVEYAHELAAEAAKERADREQRKRIHKEIQKMDREHQDFVRNLERQRAERSGRGPRYR